MFNLVLVHPQIPNNTGAIGRLCVNAGARLHIVKPIGFDISEKAVRRAGLDYWDKLDLKVWESLEEFLTQSGVKKANVHLATTKTDRPYFEAEFKEGDFLLFGSETAGLPQEVHEAFKDKEITIPMSDDGRSLNLAISCGIILYDAIRQNYKGSL
ncbi:tRNA (cytidine(34)-2'-O)-methyltransferase [hydrothermal vent metagenome]|uniref:tRNA (Cytidine(34)-2'-O)-methyltransferase n=1 Tax=hydrothermal vent metagenome TaxID=652676 RepID=A0A1W1B9Q1_9ZZZZ